MTFEELTPEEQAAENEWKQGLTHLTPDAQRQALLWRRCQLRRKPLTLEEQSARDLAFLLAQSREESKKAAAGDSEWLFWLLLLPFVPFLWGILNTLSRPYVYP